MTCLRLLALTIAFICASSAATADDFSRRCPAGSYLTGFEGTAGAWIDTIRILCAHWDAKREKFDEPIKIREMAGRSNGGNWTQAYCPDQWVVAGNYQPNFVWGDDEDVPVLHSIEFNCRPLDDNRFEPRTFGSTSSEAERFEYEPSIPPTCDEAFQGLFATGIFGTHRRFVEGLGFKCDAAPKAPAIKATKPIDSVKKPPGDPGFSKRKGGSVIASGETAPPPTTPAPTPVAKARVTSPTDVYRMTNQGAFERVGGGNDFLGQNFEAPLLLKDGGWWKLDLKNVPFVAGEGWVAADDLEEVP